MTNPPTRAVRSRQNAGAGPDEHAGGPPQEGCSYPSACVNVTECYSFACVNARLFFRWIVSKGQCGGETENSPNGGSTPPTTVTITAVLSGCHKTATTGKENEMDDAGYRMLGLVLLAK